jgi:molybdopterin-guanine dinucleotide biosynthesis protein
MHQVTIGIGGAYSGSGKTHVASCLLEILRGWGAIKYTRTSLYSSITDDPAVLSEKGKDTQRFLDAGAAKVIWVQSPPAELAIVLPMALDMLSSLQGVLIEGNSAVNVLQPDIIIFMCGEDSQQFKDSAYKILRNSQAVMYDVTPPDGVPDSAKIFKKDQMNDLQDFVKDLLKEHEQSI